MLALGLIALPRVRATKPIKSIVNLILKLFKKISFYRPAEGITIFIIL